MRVISFAAAIGSLTMPAVRNVACFILLVHAASAFDRAGVRSAIGARPTDRVSHVTRPTLQSRTALRPSPVLLVASSPPPAASDARGIVVGWGVCGFLSILASAIRRLAPIAAQPLVQRDLSTLQWGMCARAQRGPAPPC